MPSLPTSLSRAFLAGFLALGLAFGLGCNSAAGGVPEMRGSKIAVKILDSERLEFDGKARPWDEFLDLIAERVRNAKGQVDALPWVLISAKPGLSFDVTEEMLSALQELGVRSVSLGD